MAMPFFRAGMVAAGLLVLGVSAQAEVYKCKSADGKLVFSDHACALDQTGAAMPGVAKSATAPAPTRSSGEGVNDALERMQRLRTQDVLQTLSPECRELGGKVARTLRSDASMEETKRVVSEYEARCDVVGQKAKGSEKLDLGSCRSLHETLRSTGAQLGKMTDKEKMAYAKLHNEVSLACP